MDLFGFQPVLLLCLTVTGCCATRTLLPEGAVDAVVGADVVFKTLLEKPGDFMIWNFDGVAYQGHVATLGPSGLKASEPYENRVSVNATNGCLTLRAVTTADSGDFSFTRLLLDGDTQSEDVTLRVLEPVSDVLIKCDLPEAIEHNSTVVLTCSAKGSYLTFSWSNGTTPFVTDAKRYVVKNMDTSSTLTITGVLRYDLLGPIYCTAANKLEKEKSAPFNLTVYYGPDTVTIKPQTTAQFIRAGSNFSLSCVTQSYPPATFTWYHDLQPIAGSGPILTLQQIKEAGLGKQVGKYTCRAQNAKTQRVVPSPAVSFAVIEAISGSRITGPTATLIAGNSTANLSCQATAGAVTSRTWLKDGQVLSATKRHVFADDMSSMKISPLLKEDNGVYTCQLTNPIGTEDASFKMEVNFGPEPAMVAGKEAVEVNDPISLTCTALSIPPANFTWSFNGTATDVKTAQFTIEKAVYKNTGTYTCEAYNAVTGQTTSYSHKVSVNEEGTLDEGLSDGAIAGIIIAILVALGAAIGLVLYCRQKVPVESPY